MMIGDEVGIDRRSLMAGSAALALAGTSCSSGDRLQSTKEAAKASTHAVFALWYDLSDDVRTAHLEWLAANYLPHLASNPKHLFVAHYNVVGGSPAFQQGSGTMAKLSAEGVPRGSQHLLLIGASSTATFFQKDSFWRLEEQHQQVNSRLAERKEARPAVFVQEYEIEGPAAPQFPGPAPAPVIQMGSFVTSSPAGDFTMGDFYVHHRGPAMAAMPGCVRMRKLVSTAGWGKHGVIYEFTSQAERIKYFEAAEFEDHSKHSRFVSSVGRTIHLPGSPSVAVRHWPR